MNSARASFIRCKDRLSGPTNINSCADFLEGTLKGVPLSVNDLYTGTLTAASGNAAIVGADTVSSVGAYVIIYGTYAGVTVSFEGTPDGGTTWIPLGARVLNVAATSPTVITATPASNASAHYYVIVGACQRIRVRATAYTSGTASVTIQPTDETGPSIL